MPDVLLLAPHLFGRCGVSGAHFITAATVDYLVAFLTRDLLNVGSTYFHKRFQQWASDVYEKGSFLFDQTSRTLVPPSRKF